VRRERGEDLFTTEKTFNRRKELFTAECAENAEKRFFTTENTEDTEDTEESFFTRKKLIKLCDLRGKLAKLGGKFSKLCVN
jgi:hypothetical protein